MRIAVFSTRSYERPFLEQANAAHGFELVFLDIPLSAQTCPLVAGCGAACIFVNDRADAAALRCIAAQGVRILALRSAGFDHVDLRAAAELGMRVVRVPTYSPHAVAEHAIALLLTLNRRIHRAWNRVREGNFSLEGLMGFDLHGKTAGIVGTGAIGTVAARILLGFGCRVIAFDQAPDPALGAAGVGYVTLEELLARSDIVSLHLPLKADTRHLIGAAALARVKPGCLLVNTGRGGLLDTRAAIDALKDGRLGGLALDVYEGEGGLFFRDLSSSVIQDDVFARLLAFPNVVITGHQAFLTREAVQAIAETTLANIACAARGEACANELRAS